MQFGKIKDIDLPLKKFTETLEIGEIEWEVDTPDGWVDIQASGKTIEYDVWELLLENGIKLKAADKHIVVVYSLDKLNFVEKCLDELNPGDSILLKDDVSEVVHCKSLGYKEEMYDIQIANDNKLFYTNDIASHNSIWLSNLAAKAVRAGNNVAFLSMEMADRKVVKRLGANILGVKMQEYNGFARDQVAIKKKLANVGIDDLKTPGQFYIKEFPTSTASVNDIENYLLKMEDTNNMKFKIIFVDYINIMKNWRNPNTENLYMKIKQIAEDLRAMAVRNKWCVVTATQINRCLDLNSIVETPMGKKKIGEITEGEFVLTPTGFSEVDKVWPITKQKTYKIKTKSGKEIICSGIHQHPVINKNGEEELLQTNSLVIGDKLLTKNDNIKIFHTEIFNKELIQDEIVSIEEYDVIDTVDISLNDKNRVFFANGILTHNSGFDGTDLSLTNVSESAALIHTVDAMFGIIQDVVMHSNNEYVLKLLANRDEGYMNSKKKFGINYEYMRIDEDGNSQMWTED